MHLDIYDLYALVQCCIYIYGRWKSPEYEDDPTRRTKYVHTVLKHKKCLVCLHVFVRHPRRPSTKCPRDKMAGDEVSLGRNGWRRSVPATKCLATNCTRDETAGDVVSPRRNGRRRNGGDETAATTGRVYPDDKCWTLDIWTLSCQHIQGFGLLTADGETQPLARGGVGVQHGGEVRQVVR